MHSLQGQDDSIFEKCDSATLPFYRSSSSTRSAGSEHMPSSSHLLAIYCFPTSWGRNFDSPPVPQAPHICLCNWTLPRRLRARLLIAHAQPAAFARFARLVGIMTAAALGRKMNAKQKKTTPKLNQNFICSLLQAVRKPVWLPKRRHDIWIPVTVTPS